MWHLHTALCPAYTLTVAAQRDVMHSNTVKWMESLQRRASRAEGYVPRWEEAPRRKCLWNMRPRSLLVLHRKRRRTTHSDCEQLAVWRLIGGVRVRKVSPRHSVEASIKVMVVLWNCNLLWGKGWLVRGRARGGGRIRVDQLLRHRAEWDAVSQ